jgi:tRNA dimethylallyltransferase
MTGAPQGSNPTPHNRAPYNAGLSNAGRHDFGPSNAGPSNADPSSSGPGNAEQRNPVVLIAGPTCSGKSALAIALAERLNGVIINADSMQIYAELRILTARPSAEDEARVPHALYGHQPAAMPGSAALWRGQALAAIAAARASGRTPILCGGTGLYFAALTQGLAEIPDPGPAARHEARALLAAEGAPSLHARLAKYDPQTASRLCPSDGQRVARAWEVWRGTGRSLADWQADPLQGAAAGPFRAICLDPPRDDLRAAIAERFAAMIAAGGIEEVAALLSLDLDPALPAMRAHGVPELAAFLRGEITLADATARACVATGQYTKRQATWHRGRPLLPPALTRVINARITPFEQFNESWMADMQNFLLSGVDAPQRGA